MTFKSSMHDIISHRSQYCASGIRQQIQHVGVTAGDKRLMIFVESPIYHGQYESQSIRASPGNTQRRSADGAHRQQKEQTVFAAVDDFVEKGNADIGRRQSRHRRGDKYHRRIRQQGSLVGQNGSQKMVMMLSFHRQLNLCYSRPTGNDIRNLPIMFVRGATIKRLPRSIRCRTLEVR